MTKLELKEVLRLHELRILGDATGRHADLSGSDLSGANLSGADLRDANLRDANLRDVNLIGADLRDANLIGANLIGANLRGADLRDANLRDANLRDVNLIGANLRGANLRDANLRDANLRDANLDFSSGIPFSCKGTRIKIDSRLLLQMVYHLTRQDTSTCTDEENAWLKSIPKSILNGFCKYRPDLEEK